MKSNLRKSLKAAPVAGTADLAEKQGVGADTRQRLIETAARHFAEFGFEGASLRAIHREMGANPATAHYHFGSKLAVFEAIFDAYFLRIQEARQQCFSDIAHDVRGRDRLRALIRAYIVPHLEVVGEESGDPYGRLIARNVIQAQGPDMIERLQPLRERFLTEFGKLFPDATRATIARALSFTIIMMVTIPFDRSYAAMTGGAIGGAGVESWTSVIVDFATAGFEGICGPILET